MRSRDDESFTRKATRLRLQGSPALSRPLRMASESRHLLNPLAPLDEPTPSALDGVPARLERDLRACESSASAQRTAHRAALLPSFSGTDFVWAYADGALLIQQAGVMLKASVPGFFF